MPIELYGKFYTLEEIARPLGKTYSIVCRWMKRIGMKPMRIGAMYLLTSEERDELLKVAEKMETYNTCPTLKEAASILKLSAPRLEDEVNAGYIPYVEDLLKKKRLSMDTIEEISNSGLCKGRKTEWSEIRKLFVES